MVRERLAKHELEEIKSEANGQPWRDLMFGEGKRVAGEEDEKKELEGGEERYESGGEKWDRKTVAKVDEKEKRERKGRKRQRWVW